ncbi:TRAP transporter large permease [Sinanaerobacter chloroacetimidivorans]|uniref:TRAP transporter large permease n=1 Tax=Sinanaerobacter chloroacetimidivorans TaxID=2818044 RepID=A0A8J7W1G6_9FIRM|nr:TRAP transporter large permease [Sinanaerobacter chloroacetimidivorans]MBR0597838.1 TRAP transporter large permease [Sinanaerobacter chloroacetimidivorans]
MSNLILFLTVFMLLAFLRFPVPFSMGLSAIAVMLYSGLPLTSVAPAVFASLDSFTFLAIPAFIFAGDLMAVAGISTAIMNFSNSIFGRLRGAVGAVTVVTSLLFGAITGSSLATITGIGGMMLPEMLKHGYDRKYSTALISACGFLGILIPPSIPGIIYAMMSGTNLMKVWLCTVTPGIFLGISFILINYFTYGRKQEKTKENFQLSLYFGGIGKSFKESIIALLMPVIIFYGIYGGVFTPTEAGAVAVFYGLIIGWIFMPLIKKNWPEKKIKTLVEDSAISSASIAMLMVFAAVAGRMITFTRIPEVLTNTLLSVTDSQFVFLLILNVLLIIVGMFLETNTSILLLGPILIPVATSFGVDPIHFAAIMLLNLEIGMVTPPFAANLFVGCKVGKVTLDEVLPHMIPFWIACLIVLLIVTYVPSVVLFLPNLF